MNKKRKNATRAEMRFCPIRAIGFTGSLNARSVHEALIAVMSSHETKAFHIPGLHIAVKIPIRKFCVPMKRLAVYLEDISEVQITTRKNVKTGSDKKKGDR